MTLEQFGDEEMAEFADVVFLALDVVTASSHVTDISGGAWEAGLLRRFLRAARALEDADGAYNATTVYFVAELGVGESMTEEYAQSLHDTFVSQLDASVQDGGFQAAIDEGGQASLLGTTTLAVNATLDAMADETTVLFSWVGAPGVDDDDLGAGSSSSKDDDGADIAGLASFVIIGMLALLVCLCCLLLVILFLKADREEKEKAKHPAPVVVEEPRRSRNYHRDDEEEVKEGSVDALVVGFLNTDWEQEEALSAGDV